MLIFKDLFTGDELFSDSFPVELIHNCIYKVKGKLRTDTFDIDDSAIGGNASAECGEEGAESTSKQGVDIVLNGRLVEYALGKKDYMAHIKTYMKNIKDKLSDKPDVCEAFQKDVQPFIKNVLASFDDYQLFCGESMAPDGMLALMKWEEETPYMYFFKHGLDEEKV